MLKTEEKACPPVVSKRWWVLRSLRQGVKVRDILTKERNDYEEEFDFFLPTEFVLTKDKNGKQHRVERTVMFNYVFAHCSLAHVLNFTEKNKETILPIFKRRDESQNMSQKDMTDFERDEKIQPERILSIPDLQMKMFIHTVNAYKNNIPFLRPEEVDLTKGDKVRIIGGEFDGIEGILLTQQGKDGGRVLVSVSDVLCVPTLEIQPQFIEVLEFAKGGKHVYKKFDSFINKIRPALRDTLANKIQEGDWSAKTRRASAEEKLQGADSRIIIGQARQFGEHHPYYNDILVFVRRFSNFQPETTNQQCKQLTFLLMAHKVLGNEPEVARYAGLCIDKLPKIKATMTRTFTLVYLYACTGVDTYRQLAEVEMVEWGEIGASDKTRQMLREDLDYFQALKL